MSKFLFIPYLALFANVIPAYAQDSEKLAIPNHKVNISLGLTKARGSFFSMLDDNDPGLFTAVGYNYFFAPEWAIDSFIYMNRPGAPFATERTYAEGIGIGLMYKKQIGLSSWSWSAKTGMHSSAFSYTNKHDDNNLIRTADEVIRPYFGVGLDWDLTRNIGLALHYMRLNYGKDNFSRSDSYYINISYSF